ncbi:MAG: hypothetical protein HDQ88_09470 [Clostridia bacterium]|nr:hypothetical protein [Clostridia bacterium]
MAQQKDGCNPNRGVNDTQRSLFGNILSAAAILAAGYNAYKAYDIAVQEWEMAKKYWRIAENWLDYYKSSYAPVEDQELWEAMALPIAEPSYETARGRARTSAWIAYKGKLREAMRCTSRYCTGLRTDMLIRISQAQAQAVSMADGLGYRNERAYTETRNDVRWEKRLNTAKRGRDLIADVTSLGAASAGIYGSLLDQAWRGLESAGQYLGYTQNRNQPAYPSTALAGQMAQEGQKYNAQGKQTSTLVKD